MLKYPYDTTELKYGFSDLEPAMSKETFDYHYAKHYKAYCNNFNAQIEKFEDLKDKTIDKILADEKLLNENPAIRNNGGGVFNHHFFFTQFTKKDTSVMPQEVKKALEISFGSVENFKEKFKEAALSVFGSGWAWLVKDKDELKIVKTFNQDTIFTQGLKPVLTIDVWEHSYYIDYRNLRASYIEEFFTIIDWDVIKENLNA